MVSIQSATGGARVGAASLKRITATSSRWMVGNQDVRSANFLLSLGLSEAPVRIALTKGGHVPAEIQELLTSVLETLVEQVLSPTDVVQRLRDHAREADIRTALWRLIDEGRVEVTREGLLRAS